MLPHSLTWGLFVGSPLALSTSVACIHSRTCAACWWQLLFGCTALCTRRAAGCKTRCTDAQRPLPKGVLRDGLRNAPTEPTTLAAADESDPIANAAISFLRGPRA